ncbi:flavodoxin family protein [Gracilinema caldarium]|uniref:Flavodoxin domain-containing protein n=1 Tax=Gracilinema caldarium (strain ATCC 51460 / DSM 7334 / H1) TaxID=744872 RepID=F8EZC2_GRAC1|nr:flavodoxin domain-containing protein [Gracilinema caldarium]AEJ19714.1 hypothetical protein Spica_1571 [Gracilinema caldarium DSM 7334]
MKYLVVYYSHTGNNRFIAEKLAQDISADIQELVPRVKNFLLLIFSSLLHISFGNKKLSTSVADYDAVVLCGPIWMGQLIAPLRDFIKKYRNQFKKLYFLTCCGGGEAEKDGTFGCMGVFRKVEQTAGSAFVEAHAISLSLIPTENQNANPETMMGIRLTEQYFTGTFKDYYMQFKNKLRN